MEKKNAELAEVNHNPNWPFILDNPYRLLINDGIGSGKPNAYMNLIKHQRTSTRYWQNLFISQRSVWIKIPITF